jgi:4-hydroxybenzoate polyprenyltransferase
MRPRQWVKNGFVLAPLIFSGLFTDAGAIADALLAVVLFSLAASATYVINDLHDLEDDRKHPVKSRTRPLAAGQLSTGMAQLLFGLLLAALLVGYFQQPDVMHVILAYLALNLAYTYVLKYQPVLDIFTIATGFVLRVYAGAVAIDVPVSAWMSVTTLCLALYLAAIKRRQEIALSGNEGREVLKHYSVALVDRFAEMSATGALLFYSLYVTTVQPELVITIPLVLYGLFRYWFVVESLEGGESPTDALFSDWHLPLVVLIWVGTSGWIMMAQGG